MSSWFVSIDRVEIFQEGLCKTSRNIGILDNLDKI